jgi:protein-disulfide isomerase
MRAAEVSRCAAAGEARQFWAAHDALYEKQAYWSNAPTDSAMVDAVSADRNARRIWDCLAKGDEHATVEKLATLGQQLGLDGTPTFFFNGMIASGAISPDQFAYLVKQARGETPARILDRAGVPVVRGLDVTTISRPRP